MAVALPQTGIVSLCLCKTTLILSPTIANTGIGDSELEYLSGGIALTPTIQQIDLGTLHRSFNPHIDGNKISDKAGPCIKTILTKCPQLQSLNLSTLVRET